MPRVKIDYIVSFSSEDPDGPASNLLAWDVNKKKWLCSKGEPSCSVVLQLNKAVKICSLNIGAYQSALIEVLVGRSETPSEPYQVLVPSSVFQSPGEARRAGAGDADKVRSFAGDALAAARLQRWDRLRVVCSQPYNKHCKFGLSFIHVFSEEGPPPAPAPAAPARLPAPELPSSDEDEFRPGELFAKHLQKPSDSTDTGAQIRLATSHALKNIPDASIKLNKTSIAKLGGCRRRDSREPEPAHGARERRGPGAPPADRGGPQGGDHDADNTSRARDERARDTRAAGAGGAQTKQTADKGRSAENKHDEHSSKGRKNDRVSSDARQHDGASGDGRTDDDPSGDGRRAARGKRTYSDKKRDNKTAPAALLADVVFVLSGYENPRRARLRAAAQALGAAPRAAWGPACTHLVCAFPNTPKLRAVRSGAGGARAVAVRGEWVEQCARARRRLPWQWFATEPARREPPPPGWDADPPSESDTDDEIERVRQKMKRRAASPRAASPARAADVSGGSASSDVTFVRDERLQGGVTVVDSDSCGGSTDEDEAAGPGPGPGASARLPLLFAGRSFFVRGAPPRARLLERYLRAYGGLVLQEDEGAADYVVCAGGAGRAGDVRARWVWRCHRARRAESPARDVLARP